MVSSLAYEPRRWQAHAFECWRERQDGRECELAACPCPCHPHCSQCGERLRSGQDRAEVVNATTQARSLQHAECFVLHRDSEPEDKQCYVLA